MQRTVPPLRSQVNANESDPSPEPTSPPSLSHAAITGTSAKGVIASDIRGTETELYARRLAAKKAFRAKQTAGTAALRHDDGKGQVSSDKDVQMGDAPYHLQAAQDNAGLRDEAGQSSLIFASTQTPMQKLLAESTARVAQTKSPHINAPTSSGPMGHVVNWPVTC